mmetsp:Transcript_44004/g.104794  ORF Transcript_44004/g.104794 Transcript_44004/m.104794 type:complete len:291 (-) Transcript_44004:563-1435(-)
MLPTVTSKAVNALQILHALHQTVCHDLLARSQGHARVVVLLVGLLRPLRVADLGLQVVLVLLLVLVHAIPEGPLGVGVNVHLHHARLNGIADILKRGARAAVEDKGHGLVALAAQLLLHVLLSVVQDHRLQVHVARGINPVHVAEGSRHCEIAVGHGGEFLVDLPNLLRLRVETGRVHIRVVHAILLAASHTQLHLQQYVDLGHSLQVLLANGNVLLQRLLRQVQHVGREEGLAMHLEVLLVCLHEAIEPWQPGLLAVVRVEDHRHAVELGHLANMQCASHGAGDAGSIV